MILKVNKINIKKVQKRLDVGMYLLPSIHAQSPPASGSQ